MKFSLNLCYGFYFLDLKEVHVKRLREAFPHVDFIVIEKNDPAFEEKILDAEAFATWPFKLESYNRILSKASKLRWLQFSNVGIAPGYLELPRAKGWLVTNARGVASEAIAMHALALILAFERGFLQAFKMQTERCWAQEPFVKAPFGFDGLQGKLLGIVGVGNIGRALAEKACALGMHVWGIKRNPQPVPFVEKVFSPHELEKVLQESDFLMLSAPLLEETHHLIGEEALRKMKKNAYLVNVARGSLVDEKALVNALQKGEIAGAALDVAEEEPLPSTSPLYNTPNLFLTPHIAGLDRQYTDRLVDLIVLNLKNYLEGKPLSNLVDLFKGY